MQKTNFIMYLFIHLIFHAHLQYTRHYVHQKEAGCRIVLLGKDKVVNNLAYIGKARNDGNAIHCLSFVQLFWLSFKMAFHMPRVGWWVTKNGGVM